MDNVKKKSIFQKFNSLFEYKENSEYSFTIPENPNEVKDKNISYLQEIAEQKPKSEAKNVFSTLKDNLEYMQNKYHSIINSDILTREFNLIAKNKQYSAFLLYIDGMVDTALINDFILEPLMLCNRTSTSFETCDKIISQTVSNNINIRKVKKFNLLDYIFNNLMPQNSVKKVQDFDELVSSINSGNCALFVDTLDTAFDIDVKGFKQRSVDKPNNEIVVRGAQEAFTEVIRTNTSLLRRLVNNENLIIENMEVGNLSNTKCAVCYMKNIANDDLVSEVKYRLNNINVDYLISSRST